MIDASLTKFREGFPRDFSVKTLFPYISRDRDLSWLRRILSVKHIRGSERKAVARQWRKVTHAMDHGKKDLYRNTLALPSIEQLVSMI